MYENFSFLMRFYVDGTYICMYNTCSINDNMRFITLKCNLVEIKDHTIHYITIDLHISDFICINTHVLFPHSSIRETCNVNFICNYVIDYSVGIPVILLA